ncbi:MBOAT family O-acyltransferase [Castellaniella sp.]|uniref:MBOAT family O-acyltransferase n=1 Tax=Castellaniella sp. TaxID=1955812 RepID=UPI002AFF4F48|nr:MBOAT family O-acyltransferase [Castellaniella sp.]
MNFLSLEFSSFFLLFLVLYWSCVRWPDVQNVLLLAASYFILASAHPWFVLMVIAYSLGIYACGHAIVRTRGKNRLALILALTLATLNLAIFKYFDFFRDSINTALMAAGLTSWIPAIQIMVPLGISFYTFHSISYLVALQRAEIQAVSLPTLALYLAFFPSIVAGPINRAQVFLPQIDCKNPRQLMQYQKGLLLIALAIAKVVCLGAWLANAWADPVFADPDGYHALDALLGLLAYSWQLYLNFSGYTDLVTGLALLLGFKLPVNFRAPYLASNLRHFWERWHISLSTWIRDYVYIPLGGSHLGWWRTQVNLMIALLLSGLWHGSSANFLIWGGIHGLGMVLLNMGDRWLGRDRVQNTMPVLANASTFLLVSIAWIFFRSTDLTQSLAFLNTLSTHYSQTLQFNSPLYLFGLWIVLRLYPLLAQGTQWGLDHVHRLHWAVLPLPIGLLVWLALFLSPPGIPSFIYASF